jgi:serine/threonine protein kinase, bacterial
MSGSRENSSL